MKLPFLNPSPPCPLQAVRTFTCPTFFFFHVGNIFVSEDGSSLSVDLAGYDDPQILLDLGLDKLRRPQLDAAGGLQQQVSGSSYRRLTIPLQGQSGGRLQVRKASRAWRCLCAGAGCLHIMSMGGFISCKSTSWQHKEEHWPALLCCPLCIRVCVTAPVVLRGVFQCKRLHLAPGVPYASLNVVASISTSCSRLNCHPHQYHHSHSCTPPCVSGCCRSLCLSCPCYPQAPEPLVQAETHGNFCEFPAINPAQRGQAYRYSYCLSAVRPTNMGNALSKLDLQTGAAQTWHSPGGAVGKLGVMVGLVGVILGYVKHPKSRIWR
jgi:hypothetical protein